MTLPTGHAQRPCPLCRAPGAPVVLRFADVGERARTPGSEAALARCRGCGLVFLDRISSAAEEEAYYRGHAVRKLASPPTREMFDFEYARQEPVLAETARAIPVRPGLRVLDVGCGNGFLLWHLSRAGCSVRGVELDADLAAFDRDALGLAVTHGDIGALAPGEVFDCVVLTDVVEHLPDPLAVLGAIRERLAPGGTLVLKTPNWNLGRRHVWLARLRGRMAPNLLIQGEHLTYFTPRTLRRLLTEAGFGDVRVRPAESTYLSPGRSRAAGAWLVRLSRLVPERWIFAPCLLALGRLRG